MQMSKQCIVIGIYNRELDQNDGQGKKQNPGDCTKAVEGLVK